MLQTSTTRRGYLRTAVGIRTRANAPIRKKLLGASPGHVHHPLKLTNPRIPERLECRSVMGFVSTESEQLVNGAQVQGNLLTSRKGLLQIYSSEGTNTKLEMIISFLDKEGNEVAPVDVSKFPSKPWKVKVDGVSEVKGVVWEGAVELPAGTRSDLIITKMKPKGKVEQEFINEITVMAGDTTIEYAPNSWIHRNNGGRVFFSTKLALLPQDTPTELREWRKADLDDIKGSRIEKALARQYWDRIYDYDVYNDLAELSDDRPVLGGNPDFPYPRRVRTGRARAQAVNGVTYEVREQPFWIPLNERFNSRKQANFKTYSLLGKLTEKVQKIISMLDLDGFNSFQDVDKMYAKLSDPVLSISDDEDDDSDSGDWTKNPLASAVIGSIKKVRQQGGGAQSLLKFPPPAVWQNRTREWTKDEEWGRQALAGVNPCCVSAVRTHAQLGSISEDQLAAHLEGHTLEALLAEATKSPRLLVIEHVAVVEQYAERVSKLDGRYGYSGRAVLYRRNDDSWVPVGIELKAGCDGSVDVYTPADHTNVWLLAKGVFNSIDAGIHQLVTHWLRTHACTEPYIISTRRNLSSLHPVFQLLMPHFASTMEINTNARMRLIAANSTIESIFTPGPYAIRMSSEVYKHVWRFDKEGLPEDLIKRGLATRENGSLKLLLNDYPYADDGMLLWNALEKWISGYLNLYYNDSKEGRKISDDPEITAWWHEIVHVGHADKQEGWPKLATIADLTQILTTMIWVASGHHAAINFSQYPFNGYAPNRPSICRKRIPKRDSKEFKDLISSGQKGGEKAYVDTLLHLDSVLRNALTVMLLSGHADNEAYIGEPYHTYIKDPQALGLYSKFVKEIQDMEKTIEARNRDSSRKMRSSPGLPYTCLDPTSGPGITNRGVPQSISI